MNAEELIDLGNTSRENNNPEQALSYYAQAIAIDRNNANAFNNYGNVLREIGDPEGGALFLKRAIQLNPAHTTAQFNLAVAYLLAGNYDNGWTQYEHRWNFEHLNGLLPQYSKPRWNGEDLKDKTILVTSEQGHGDNIQFSRFLKNLKELGATVVLQIDNNVGSVLVDFADQIIEHGQEYTEFDYWTPIMSIPRILKINLDNLPSIQKYIRADNNKCQEWLKALGPKRKLRVGFCWSGRRDTWINRHKGMPVETMMELISQNQNYDWFNLQLDATPEDTELMRKAGVAEYPGVIKNFADTAALISTLDVVISVDTAVAHLSGALGVPTWIMLNNFGLDWRWLLDRDSSPWYPTARLFRQPTAGDWKSVTNKIQQYLSWFKV